MELEHAPNGRHRRGAQDRELLDRAIAVQEREERHPEASQQLVQEEGDADPGPSPTRPGRVRRVADLHRAVRIGREEAVRASLHPRSQLQRWICRSDGGRVLCCAR